MARRNQIEDALVRILVDLGIPYSVDHTRVHPVIRFQVGAAKLQYFFPGTPTCPRALANSTSGLRRLIRQAQNECVRAASASAR